MRAWRKFYVAYEFIVFELCKATDSPEVIIDNCVQCELYELDAGNAKCKIRITAAYWSDDFLGGSK